MSANSGKVINTEKIAPIGAHTPVVPSPGRVMPGPVKPNQAGMPDND